VTTILSGINKDLDQSLHASSKEQEAPSEPEPTSKDIIEPSQTELITETKTDESNIEETSKKQEQSIEVFEEEFDLLPEEGK
jgi:hypothetical protein